MPRTRRNAFTLIEIVIVVALIAFLAAMLLLGLRSVTEGSRRRQTKATMEAMNAMLTEFELLTKLEGMTGPGVSLESPGDLASPAGRGHDTVEVAGATLAAFRAIPQVRPTIDGWPANGLVRWGEIDATPAPGAFNLGTPYVFGNRVSYAVAPNPPRNYVCVRGTSEKVPTDSGYWALEDDSNPILLDGWRNPILIIPGGGLYGPDDAGNPMPTGIGVGMYTVTDPRKAPDGRPFFASGGPDGNMNTDEDNVYSFE